MKKGSHHTKESIAKLKEIKGEKHHFFGKKRPNHSKKMKGVGNPMCGIHRYGEESPHWQGGRSRCAVCNIELSGYDHNYCKEHLDRSGENNPSWKGGVTSLYLSIRSSDEYREWRDAIKNRDNFTCQYCGDKIGGNLHSHHIKMFNEIIEENNITTFEAALNCSELWDLDNGVTYCENCHKLLNGKGGVL